MSNKLIYIGILIALIFTQSCTTKETNIEKMLSRNWSFDTELGPSFVDSTTFLNLSFKKLIEQGRFPIFDNFKSNKS